ncbi:MAG: hypothetical protein V4650_00135 [Pseudomonadota bacterium]
MQITELLRSWLPLLLMALVPISSSGVEALPEPIAWVEQVTPVPRADQAWMSIRRGEGGVAITEPYTYLNKGDVLTVQPPFNVVVQWVTGEKKTLSVADGSATIVEGRRAASTAQNLMSWLSEVLRPQTARPPYQVSLSTRGDVPLSLPLLEGERQEVLANSGGLHFAWRGGSAPYTITVSGKNGKTIRQVGALASRSALLGKPGLPPAVYAVRIIDGSGKTAEGEFAVAAQLRYDLPPALAQSQVQGAARLVMEALWLAGEQPQLRFEAYQRLTGLRGESAPARTWVSQWEDLRP